MLLGSDSALVVLRRLLGDTAGGDAGDGHREADGAARSAIDELMKTYPGLREAHVDEVGGPWIWATSAAVPSRRKLRDSAAYELLHPKLLGLAPDELTRRIADKDIPDNLDADEALTTYVRRSADLTMKGGTTSGVIYPLAVCEIARDFRLRNIGGASAGAIAAAAAAAAELGRQRGWATANTEEQGLTNEDRANGHVRRGFAGLADLVAFLTQIDDPDATRDEFRLGQLFRPTGKAAPVFRLLVAFMRGRIGVIPLLLAGAFGWVSKVATALLLVASCTLAGAAARSGGWTGSRTNLWSEPSTPIDWVLAPLEGLVGIVGLGLAMVGLIMLAVALGNRRRPPDPELDEPVRRSAGTGVGKRVRAGLGILVSGALLLVVAIGFIGIRWWVLIAVAAWLLLAQIVVLVASVAAFVLRAKGSAFGLIAGASPHRRRSGWDRAAGVPKDRVRRSLMDWLSESYSELAGIPGRVLRFGHLWQADDEPDPEAQGKPYVEPGLRRINLELITTELVHGQSYKFPLLECDEFKKYYGFRLYVRISDLRGDGDPLLPEDVIKVLEAGLPPDKAVRDIATGELIHDEREAHQQIDDLRLLPQPADLPVIFAVRLSLSFPGLFRAVRLYRVVDDPSHVRDDLGRQILGDEGEPLVYPARSTGDVHWAEELWFSDGGITSNFPAHLFDSLLPRWPTFGINLGPYPAGFAHQDVFLPLDWQTKVAFGAPVRRGMVGFLLAILDTARNWRDNAQMVMPSYRGRIASVHQRSSEGGNNLFMSRKTIAELAVRGSFAGMRLGRRFRDDAMWNRHLWLRFRGAVQNLRETGVQVNRATAVGLYEQLRTSGAAGVIAGLPAVATGDPDLPRGDRWFNSTEAEYFSTTGQLLANLPTSAPNANDDIPLPKPELRQVPFV